MKKEWTKTLLTTLLCNIFLAGTLLVFSPLEVFIGNPHEFLFQFDITWKVMILATLAVVAFFTLLEMFLPQKIGLILNSIVTGLGICCYVQMMFLNGSMVTMNGSEMYTTRFERILNIGIWAAILLMVVAGVIYAAMKRKEGIAHAALRYAACMLTLIQAIALLIYSTTVDLSREDNFQLLGEGQFEIAPRNNTLVFVLDTSGSVIMEQVLIDYPDVYEALSGFTYYPNATSMYSRTYPALTYMLTGEPCYFDKPYEVYVEEAFEKGSMLKDLKRAGVDNRIYTWDTTLIGKKTEKYISNSSLNQFNSIDDVSIHDLICGMLKISLYKAAPYRLKYELDYDIQKINRDVIQSGDEEEYQHYDYDFYQDLCSATLQVNKKYKGAFRLYHLFGSHYNMFWDENMSRMEKPTSTQALRGSLRILEEYVAKLEEAGLLDETTIIVTADHGSSGSGNSLDIKEIMTNAPRPMMLIKYPKSDMNQRLQISTAPVCHDDLFSVIVDGCGLDASNYGRAILEIAEDEQRERYYYYSALYSNEDGEIVLREYRIDGDARNLDDWQLTGRYWDIDYSYNKVSEQRYMQ